MPTDADIDRYPIGRFAANPPEDAAARRACIDRIAACPARLADAIDGLNDAQLDTPYRDGGWTARQVVHHLPDSHMNAYIRMKLALTEDTPTIRPYFEDRFARLADYRETPVQTSLTLLATLHARWTVLLDSLDEAAWRRTFVHPESGPQTLAQAVDLYAWHGGHHVGQVVAMRARQGF